MIREHIFGSNGNVFEMPWRNQTQRHVTINPAEGQVINLAAERGDVGALSRVQFNGEYVFAIPINMRSEIEREWGVTAFVFTQTLAINPDRRRGHGAFEIDKDALATALTRQTETAAVD